MLKLQPVIMGLWQIVSMEKRNEFDEKKAIEAICIHMKKKYLCWGTYDVVSTDGSFLLKSIDYTEFYCVIMFYICILISKTSTIRHGRSLR